MIFWVIFNFSHHLRSNQITNSNFEDAIKFKSTTFNEIRFEDLKELNDEDAEKASSKRPLNETLGLNDVLIQLCFISMTWSIFYFNYYLF